MPRELLTTPSGFAYWAKVFEPEVNRLRPDKPRQWSISLCIPSDDQAAHHLAQTIEQAFMDHHGGRARQSKNAWPYGEMTEKAPDGNPVPTGLIEFKFKRNETTKRGNTLPPPVVYDAKKGPWPDGVLIGNRSLVKVAYSPWCWTDEVGGCGVSLSLEAVQVIDLVEYVQRDPGDVFQEEDGYVADPRAGAFQSQPADTDLAPAPAQGSWRPTPAPAPSRAPWPGRTTEVVEERL